MDSRFASKFFLPSFLLKPVIGLDISDQSIKFLELLKKGGQFKIGRFGEEDIPYGVIEEGELKDREAFRQVLLGIKNKWHLHDVVISLPDGQVCDEDLIYRELEKIFVSAGLNLLAIERRGQALARALINEKNKSNKIIVDLGKNHTSTFLVNDGVVRRESVTPIGGKTLTNNLQKILGVEHMQAEQIKKNKGLSRALENRIVFEAILPAISVVRDDIEKLINTHQTNLGEVGEIDHIILTGGQASLPGLAEYLDGHFRGSVIVANPWVKVFPVDSLVKELSYKEALRYSAAIGLSLRNFVDPRL